MEATGGTERKVRIRRRTVILNYTKRIQCTLILLACLILLAGCGNSAENSDISEKLKEKAETVSGQEASAGSIIP